MVVEDEEREILKKEEIPEGWGHGDQVVGPKIKK